MEQGVRFWRSTFIQLPAAHRFAEYIPLVGTLQNPCPYSGIRHSHSGQFPVGTLRFQTKRLIFLKSIIFNYNIYPGLLRKIIYLQSIYHTHLRNEESNPTDSGLQRRSDAPYPISALDRTYQRNSTYAWEILFINDGSSDRTLDVIRQLRQTDSRVNFVNLSRNFGKEIAMLAGFDYTTGDCCVVMDADLQDPPELVDRMLQYWEEGYDDIYAKRRNRGEESWMRRRLSLAFYSILQKMSRIDILPNVGDFRLLDRRCVLTLRHLREQERYTKGLFCWIGYRKKSIEFDRGDRLAGHSSWSFFKLLNLAIEGITSSSTAPLRIATVCGILCSISSFIYAIYFLIKTIIYGDQAAGFPTLIVVILFLGGIQLFSLGVIGEYIGRIFKETKRRPAYIASDYNEKKLGYDE